MNAIKNHHNLTKVDDIIKRTDIKVADIRLELLKLKIKIDGKSYRKLNTLENAKDFRILRSYYQWINNGKVPSHLATSATYDLYINLINETLDF